MPSWQARIATAVVRWRVKPALGDMSDLGRVRKVFDAPLPVPRGTRWSAGSVGGVHGEWLEAARPASADSTQATSATTPSATTTTLLYIHGGGFVGCSARSHRSLTASFALRGLRVFAPDYRLAPEHPFPAALTDVLAVWRALREQQAGARLVVAGDSAGGNLALALMLALRDAGEPLPDAAALFSPALDLTGASRSLVDNSPRDAMFDGPSLQRLADAYLAGADAAQPLVSPLNADLAGLPPLLVHVGHDEVLRDDSLRLATKARAAGVAVQLRVFGGVAHVWQLLWRLPEARASVGEAAQFLATAQRGGFEHHDVVIVGAGLSGIGAAAHLQQRCPGTSWTMLEARGAIGGTWDLFRYPGVRADSDMYTLGYAFKPWRGGRSITDGAAIRGYIAETAAERGIDLQVRLQHRVVRADWSSERACWTVVVERGDAREKLRLSCRFLLFCSGYYRYAQGYRPPFPGEARYRGVLVHPQAWPPALQHAGRRVLVIGSGATAVTLVPALAATAAHVTMLQRSPSYVVARPAHDALAAWLEARLPARLAYALVRLKNVAVDMAYFRFARRWPRQTRERIVAMARHHLGRGFDMAHFTPRYDPWDQRVCLVPDADLFAAIRSGRAEVVTDTIATFTERGVRLQSGREIDADIVVTATGLELNVLGDAAIAVDGAPVDLAQRLTYKGLMYDGVPNLAATFGYTNASWTLKADLTAAWVCRLLKHMARRGHAVATPRRGEGVQPAPFIDFSSGYVQRALDRLPKQGTTRPWRLHQNYLLDVLTLRFGRLDDGTLAFAAARRRGANDVPREGVAAPPLG